MRKVALDKDLKCDVRALRWQLDKNTICLAGTAPDYPYGNFSHGPSRFPGVRRSTYMDHP